MRGEAAAFCSQSLITPHPPVSTEAATQLGWVPAVLGAPDNDGRGAMTWNPHSLELQGCLGHHCNLALFEREKPGPGQMT